MGLLCIRLGNQDEMEKTESPEETSVEIESSTDLHPQNKKSCEESALQKRSRPDGFTGESNRIYGDQSATCINGCRVQNNERKFPNSFLEASLIFDA